MNTKYNVHYGAYHPDEIIYAPDLVAVNINLHTVEVQLEEETEIDWVADEVYEYTYQEYTQMQASVIASQKAINEEQDELIAELIEG